MARHRNRHRDDSKPAFEEQVVNISRVATVVKGGRRFSFNALVVVGDKKGKVGFGFGKAKEVPHAVEKAVKDAHKNLIKVTLIGEGKTLPHQYTARFGASKLAVIPAHPGTGIVAGPAVRAVMGACGVENILTKSLGSHNPINLVKAAFEALKGMKTKEQAEKLRGVTLDIDEF